jgi:hypothetical protein
MRYNKPSGFTVKQQCGISETELDRRANALIKKAYFVKHPNATEAPRRALSWPDIVVVMDSDMMGASISWGWEDPYVNVRL